MSAAFLGNVVEKDIHKSSLIAAICFAAGMAGTGVCIWLGGNYYAANGKGSVLALIGIYLCYGLIMGIGLGTGYLSPVKTLMLWFSDQKGLATGLAVARFGAAKAIASPIMEKMLGGLGDGGIYKMFLILAAVVERYTIFGGIVKKMLSYSLENTHFPSSFPKNGYKNTTQSFDWVVLFFKFYSIITFFFF